MKQCNYCYRKDCDIIHSHWGSNNDKIPYGRLSHRFLYLMHSKCKTYIPIPRSKGFATLFEIALDNKPQDVYNLLSEFDMKVLNNWVK